MIFYTAFFELNEGKPETERRTRAAERKVYRDIAARTERFNRTVLKNKGRAFLRDCEEGGFTACLIAEQIENAADVLKRYGKTMFPGARCAKAEETTFQEIRGCLRTAFHNDTIENDDDVLQEFGLTWLTQLNFFGERILDTVGRRELEKTADACLARETLMPELRRIYAGRALQHGLGHPVHYMIRTDSSDVRRTIHRTLLGALYQAGRIRNKRFCYIDVDEDVASDVGLAALYKSCTGGAILLRFQGKGGTEGNTANTDRLIADAVGRLMNRFRNEVLTVLCVPRSSSGMRDLLYENLSGLTLVEIADELLAGERARDYLRMRARTRKMRSDKALFEFLEEGKEYYADELDDMFEEWHAEKLKNVVYPQYRELEAVMPAEVSAPRGPAIDDLQSMIGLDKAKTVIRQAIDYYKAQKLFAGKGIKSETPAMHMLFTGNPGTAKTTVARLFAGIMRENGLLAKGHIVEVGRGDLVGKYVGWTAPTIQKKFKEAKGGVLFIDEAYSLVDGRDGGFGDEAINTIVQEMENNRADVAVIFAGYPDKMAAFLKKNPGLRSRIAFHVAFDDYDTEELCAIADLQAKAQDLTITPEARQKLALLFEAARRDPDFGNGRYVRNVLERACMAKASRLMHAPDPEALTREQVNTITAADVMEPPVLTVKRAAIGFGA